MKKVLIEIFCLFAAAQISYSEEVVKNSLNEEIVLLDDGRWMPKERVDRIRAFEEDVRIETVRIDIKKNDLRAVTVRITNNSKEDLEYLVYGIKFKFGEEYSLRKIVAANDIPAGESIEICRMVSVRNIVGRDMVTDIIDFKFK